MIFSEKQAPMLETQPKQHEDQTEEGSFGKTTKYINDELELIHDQNENIVLLASQLNKAFSQAEKMKKLMHTVKKMDKIIIGNLTDKRKQESSMIHTIEYMKDLMKEQRFEDIDHLLRKIQLGSQEKLKLSQKELYNIRNLMTELNESYEEAAGFCRLYQVLYVKLANIYDSCKEELDKELTEEEDLHKARNYNGEKQGKSVMPMAFRHLLGDGFGKWFDRY